MEFAKLLLMAISASAYATSYHCTDECITFYEFFERSECGLSLLNQCFLRCVCELK